ncbi:MAG: hypothetical protein ACI9ON_004419 [Limisphaerales bacterium]
MEKRLKSRREYFQRFYDSLNQRAKTIQIDIAELWNKAANLDLDHAIQGRVVHSSGNEWLIPMNFQEHMHQVVLEVDITR